MRKIDRQKHLLNFIQTTHVSRQEDIVKYFEDLGNPITQATISRDINELGIVKVPIQNGGFFYGVADTQNQLRKVRLKKLMQQAFLSMKSQRGMVYIKVQPGNGPVLANLIEQADFEEVFTAMPSDDSIMVFLKPGVEELNVVNEINKLVGR